MPGFEAGALLPRRGLVLKPGGTVFHKRYGNRHLDELPFSDKSE